MEPITQATDYLFKQGILGVIVVLEGIFILWLLKRIDTRDKQIDTLQEKRVAETLTYANGNLEISKDMVATGKDTINSVNLLQKSIDNLANGMQSLLNKKI